MKHFFKLSYVVLGALLLVGCGATSIEESPLVDSNGNAVEELTIDLSDANTEDVVPVGKGATCGEGIAVCDDGLLCVGTSADASEGVCKVLDRRPDIICDNEAEEVCGVVDNVARTFLNSCYAKKSGAEVKYDGYCEAGRTE